MHAEVHVLLTLEQFQQVVPDTLACYLPYGTLILYEAISLPITHIIGLCEVPHCTLRWDATSRSLLQVSTQVSECVLLVVL